MRIGLFAAFLVLTSTATLPGAAVEVPPGPSTPPVVVAVVEEGLNVLHDDFRATDGVLRIPPGVGDPVRWVDLPTGGNFRQRRAELAAGPLGRLDTSSLYALRGTRLLVRNIGSTLTGPTSVERDVMDEPEHGTGVASALGGTEHGSDPEVLIVVVMGSYFDWEWLADQSWIDFVSTSYVSGPQCPEGRALARIRAQGRLVISGVGNGSPSSLTNTPSGHPENYLVGGADADGRPYIGGPPASPPAMTTPLFESSHLFESMTASFDSFDGARLFRGTSGSAPRLAGEAAKILRRARSILGSHWTGTREGKFARFEPGGRRPLAGPLSDGSFDRAELVDILHRTSVPVSSPGPDRYLREGYGAFLPESLAMAYSVLEGSRSLAPRSQDDQAHAAARTGRSLLFPPARCAAS